MDNPNLICLIILRIMLVRTNKNIPIIYIKNLYFICHKIHDLSDLNPSCFGGNFPKHTYYYFIILEVVFQQKKLFQIEKRNHKSHPAAFAIPSFCLNFYFHLFSKNVHKRYMINPQIKNNAINIHIGTLLS